MLVKVYFSPQVLWYGILEIIAIIIIVIIMAVTVLKTQVFHNFFYVLIQHISIHAFVAQNLKNRK